MISVTRYPNRIAQIYGSMIAVGLIAYFLICYFAGLIHIVELRLLNFLFMMAGIYGALRQTKKTHDNHLNYFRAMGVGVYTSGIAVSTFAGFLFLIFLLDTKLYNEVVKNAPFGQYLNIYIATFAVFVEGIFSGLMATFMVTNFLRTDEI